MENELINTLNSILEFRQDHMKETGERPESINLSEDQFKIVKHSKQLFLGTLDSSAQVFNMRIVVDEKSDI